MLPQNNMEIISKYSQWNKIYTRTRERRNTRRFRNYPEINVAAVLEEESKKSRRNAERLLDQMRLPFLLYLLV